jgi:hypothetical protein
VKDQSTSRHAAGASATARPQAPGAERRISAEEVAAEAAARARTNLAQRQLATERTLARFRHKPFSWAGANCIRLARTQAANMGHQLPPVPRFRSLLGAKRALAARGAESVTALLDQHFARLPGPAFAWLGDLVVGPADPAHGLEAVGIADGQGNVWGWSEQNGHAQLVAILSVNADLTGAWRL